MVFTVISSNIDVNSINTVQTDHDPARAWLSVALDNSDVATFDEASLSLWLAICKGQQWHKLNYTSDW